MLTVTTDESTWKDSVGVAAALHRVRHDCSYRPKFGSMIAPPANRGAVERLSHLRIAWRRRDSLAFVKTQLRWFHRQANRRHQALRLALLIRDQGFVTQLVR